MFVSQTLEPVIVATVRHSVGYIPGYSCTLALFCLMGSLLLGKWNCSGQVFDGSRSYTLNSRPLIACE